MRKIIIVYHGIGKEDKFMQVELEEFKRQINYLIKKDFNICFFEEILKTKKKKNICIMFDDGLISSKEAIEWLENQKIKYNLAIVENYINKQGYLDLSYIKKLKYAKIYFHTQNHRILTELNSNELNEEIYFNLDIFNKEVIVYPQGIYDCNLFECFEKRGFKYGLTVNPYHMSNKHTNYEIPRICINGLLKKWKFKLFIHKIGNLYLHLAVLKRRILKQNILK